MKSAWLELKTDRHGLRRGSKELRIRNASKLRRNKALDSIVFEIGDFKWRLTALRRFKNPNQSEMLVISLISCNTQGVHAHVSLTVLNPAEATRPSEGRKRSTCAFHSIDKLEIPFDVCVNSCELLDARDEVIVVVDLQDIRAAAIDEVQSFVTGMKTTVLEVITDASVCSYLSEAAVGVALEDRKRNSDVYGCSLVRFWATHSLDHRYWLCDRHADGKLVVKRCLNDAEPSETFDQISDELDGGYPWVTVFCEEKPSHESFPKIDADTIIAFCKFCESGYKEKAYLGHLVVSKKIPCYEASFKLRNEMVQIPDAVDCVVYREDEKPHRDISMDESTLEASGVYSGSVLILKEGQCMEDDTHEEFRPPLSEGDSDESRDGHDKCFGINKGNCFSLDCETTNAPGPRMQSATTMQRATYQNEQRMRLTVCSEPAGNGEGCVTTEESDPRHEIQRKTGSVPHDLKGSKQTYSRRGDPSMLSLTASIATCDYCGKLEADHREAVVRTGTTDAHWSVAADNNSQRNVSLSPQSVFNHQPESTDQSAGEAEISAKLGCYCNGAVSKSDEQTGTELDMIAGSGRVQQIVKDMEHSVRKQTTNEAQQQDESRQSAHSRHFNRYDRTIHNCTQSRPGPFN